MKPNNIGSSLDDFLLEEGIYENVTAAAIKRVLARRIVQEMAGQNRSKLIYPNPGAPSSRGFSC